jgi:NitT/TauT family transport system substrate-binding protein
MLGYPLKRFGIASLAIGLLVIAISIPAAAADQVNFALDWVVSGVHAGYFVAEDKGYYSAAGLDVTIGRGFGSGDTIKRVGSGTATFGLADTSAIIAALANVNVPVRIVAMIYDHATVGVIYLKESGIKAPKDLEGRKIGRSASGASVNMFPAFLKANNIDRSKIHEVVVDGATFVPLLVSGQVDAVLEQSIELGKFRNIAAQQGKTALAMPYSEFGLVGYGNAIIADLSTIQQKPDMVRRFVEASLKGVAYSLAHPDEAVAILRKTNPEVDAKVAHDELVELNEMENTDQLRERGLGYVDNSKMEENRDNITGPLSLKRTVPAAEIYTNEFLPKKPIVPSGK